MEKSHEKPFKITFDLVNKMTVNIYANDAEQASLIAEDTWLKEDFKLNEIEFKLVSVVPVEKT